MDKYEFSMKIDEIKKLAANGQYRKAGKVLESIEIRKIKNIKDLYVVVDILVENEKYDQAKAILVEVYRKLKSRRVVHQLIDVCMKAGELESARKYMKDFRKLAPNDPYNFVFEYEAAKLADLGYDKQIEILEDLKQHEYVEKWAYELAKVYHKADRDQLCVAECNDLILWFGEGVYVEKAKLLKQYLLEDKHPDPTKATKKVTLSKERDESTDSASEWIKPLVQEERRMRRQSKPSYQTAFDFIESMELEEQKNQTEVAQDQTNEFIKTEATENFGKETISREGMSEMAPVNHVVKYDQEAENGGSETEVISESIPNDMSEESEMISDQEAMDESEPKNEETVSVVKEAQEYKVANEREVRNLVNSTTEALAAEIGDLFSELNEEGSEAVLAEECAVVEDVALVNSEAREPEVEDSIIEESEVEEQEIEEPEVEKPEVEEQEIEEPEVEKPEIEEPEIEEPEIEEPEIEEPEVEGPEVEEPEIQPSEIQDSVIEELEPQEPEVQDSEIQNEQVHESEVLEPEEITLVEDNSEESVVAEPAPEALIQEETIPSDEIDQLVKKRKQLAIKKQMNEFISEYTQSDEIHCEEYLGEFIQIQSIADELLVGLENIAAAHNKNVSILIQGLCTFDQTYFARKLAKLLLAMNMIQNQKLAVIGYDKLIEIDFTKHIDQIRGGCVIVEEVNEYTQQLLTQIRVLHQAECLVILETASSVEADEKICADYSIIQKINIESFDAEQYLGFVDDFCLEREYSLEEDARVYMHAYAVELEQSQDKNGFCKLLEKMTKAYHCANQRNKVELRNIAESGNFQDAAFMSIKAIDFANEN